MAITAADFELPGGIESYEQFKKLKKRQNSSRKGMLMMRWVRKSFSFYSQLSCKIKTFRSYENEEFVAQLAQFSQLEATTSMSESLNGLVGSSKRTDVDGRFIDWKKSKLPVAQLF